MNLFQGFYEEVASPLLLEVDLRYPDNAVDFLTTNHFNQLFNGTEIVVAGRVTDNDLDNFLVEVLGQGVRKQQEVAETWRQCCCFFFYSALWTPFLLLFSL